MTRKEFKLTDKQYKKLLRACRPTPVISFDGKTNAFGTPQENANRAWSILGHELGFDYMSVRPVPGKSDRFFTAEVRENKQA